MEISVSVELIGSFSEQKSNDVAIANIVIKSIPVANRKLIGRQIEKLVWEQYQSALRLAYNCEKLDGKLTPKKT